TEVDDLRAYRPADEAFTLFVQAMIGPIGEKGEESFGFTICSSEWIRQNCTEPMLGLHLLIVSSYDYDRVLQFVSKIVSACGAETWYDCALKPQRLGSWEFEDHHSLSDRR